jgi:hypothetical protein
MKIIVEFDMTPEEFRQSLGLPDVQEMHREMMDLVVSKMEAGDDGYDPLTFYTSFMEKSIANVPDLFMNMMASNNKKSSHEG